MDLPLDQHESYLFDLDEDRLALFDIPEEIFPETPQNSDSDDNGLYDNLGDDGGILEPDDLAPTSSGDGSGRNVPDVIIQLQEKLLKGYKLPPYPDQAPSQPALSPAEIWSLHHYFAWVEFNGTVKAYNAHALVLSHATKEEILSLHKVRKLALDLAGLTTSFMDMYPKAVWLILVTLSPILSAPRVKRAKCAMNHAISHSKVLLELNQSQGQKCFTYPSCQSFRHTMPVMQHLIRCATEIIA